MFSSLSYILFIFFSEFLSLLLSTGQLWNLILHSFIDYKLLFMISTPLLVERSRIIYWIPWSSINLSNHSFLYYKNVRMFISGNTCKHSSSSLSQVEASFQVSWLKHLTIFHNFGYKNIKLMVNFWVYVTEREITESHCELNDKPAKIV